MGLLGTQIISDDEPDEPRVLDIQGADAERAFDALGSETARAILKSVYEQPRTPPQIQEEVGTSLQNVHYHLERLEAADIIEPGGMGYSQKGNEMTVYAPSNEALVLFAGEDQQRSRLEELLGRLLSLYFILATVTYIVALATRRAREGAFGAEADLTADAQSGGATGLDTGFFEGIAQAVFTDPAVTFFAGGMVVILVIIAGTMLRGDG